MPPDQLNQLNQQAAGMDSDNYGSHWCRGSDGMAICRVCPGHRGVKFCAANIENHQKTNMHVANAMRQQIDVWDDSRVRAWIEDVTEAELQSKWMAQAENNVVLSQLLDAIKDTEQERPDECCSDRVHKFGGDCGDCGDCGDGAVVTHTVAQAENDFAEELFRKIKQRKHGHEHEHDTFWTRLISISLLVLATTLFHVVVKNAELLLRM